MKIKTLEKHSVKMETKTIEEQFYNCLTKLKLLVESQSSIIQMLAEYKGILSQVLEYIEVSKIIIYTISNNYIDRRKIHSQKSEVHQKNRLKMTHGINTARV